MDESTKSVYSRTAELTRPDLSLEEEAEICGIDKDKLYFLRYNLEHAPPGSRHEAALNRYAKATSVTLAEAAVMLGRPPVRLETQVRRGSIPAFKHRNRWRIWMADLRKMPDFKRSQKRRRFDR